MAHSLSGNSGSLSILAGAQNGISEEEARILRGLRAGVESAYQELIDRYEQPIFNMVYRLLGNQTDACDVVQEVFLKVFRRVNCFRKRRVFLTWIFLFPGIKRTINPGWFLAICRRRVPSRKEGR